MHNGMILVSSGKSQEKWIHKAYVRAHGEGGPDFRGGEGRGSYSWRASWSSCSLSCVFRRQEMRARRRRGRVEMGALAERLAWPSLCIVAAGHTQRWGK